MTRETRKFERHGLLALDPRAFLGVFLEQPKPVNTIKNDVEIVAISGPLDHHAGDWCDSYEGILERLDAALAGPCATVVLKLDSPGGLVSGCFDTARQIRARARAAGKRLVCHVDGQACSAAYALAAAADTIVASETSMVGSIGIVDTRVDVTAADAAQGIRFAFLSSSARKTDGNIHHAVSTAELVDKQRIVDSLAAVFFGLVKDLRGLDAAPLEARVFVGAEAKARGLVDEVQSFGDLLASIAGANKGKTNMASAYEQARAALEEAANGDDENEAARAKRALAAMDGPGDDDDDKPEGEAESEAESEPEGESSDDDDDKSKEPEGVKAIAASTAGALASEVARLSARLERIEREKEAAERSALLASRADLGRELVKVLEGKPFAEVKAIVSAIPKPVVPNAAATATVSATRGAGHVDALTPVSSPEAAAMDHAMGLTRYDMGVRREGNSVVFGAMPVAAAPGAGKVGAK